MMKNKSLALLLSAAILFACTDDDGGILTVRATGAVAGVAFIDRNANSVLDPAIDGPLARLRVALVLPTTNDTVERAVTGSDGGFLMTGIPVGTYQLVADPLSAGDSLEITSPARALLTVPANDTAVTSVSASYPVRTVAEARLLPAGRKVFVTGIAVSGWSTFGDSTVHIVSGTSAIRVVRAQLSPVVEGDSVRVLARTGVRDGQPALVDATITILGSTFTPAPVRATTAETLTAVGGTRDAAPVRIENATIITTSAVAGGDLLLSVNDGSGRGEVLLDASAPLAAAPFVAGAILDASGVLVPVAGTNTWRLKPRSERDLTVRFPRVTIAEARALSAGRRVTIEGVAQNSFVNFTDGSIHIADATGSLRAFYTGPIGIYAADSVRLVGTLAFRTGDLALIDVAPVVLGSGARLPDPRQVSTATASNADAGRLAAALVRVSNASVLDTLTTTTGVELTVDDGTGPVRILLDATAGFTRGLYLPGRVLDIVGLLAPRDFGGAWQIKPRSRADVVSR